MPGAEVGVVEIVLLALAALCAGLIDAIAGGGGLITLPALLAVGLPPHEALGTNKGQSVFGSFGALVRYHHSRLVDLRRARLTFPAGFLGSLAGAALVMRVPPETLRPLVLVLLVAVALFLTFHRKRDAPPPDRHPVHTASLAIGLAAVIGTYDGFFGPGTGTFLIAGLVWLLGLTLSEATADAKVVNFASNLAAVVLFGARGVVLWQIALPMAAGQFAGAWIGAHFAVRGGEKLIRAVVLLVVAALVIKIGADLRGR